LRIFPSSYTGNETPISPAASMTREIDKTDVDQCPLGSLMIRADTSNRLRLDVAGQPLLQLCQRIQNEHDLCLNPLRLFLLTADLAETASRWQRALGMPEAGVSNQPEGVAVSKFMCWGNDEESARSIIIIADTLAAGTVAGDALAVAGVAHELGHVHDEFLRGVALGFSESRTPPGVKNWPKVCAYIAEMAWSEYAAESIGASHMSREELRDAMANDPVHLAGVHGRLRRLIWNYKCGRQDLFSMWCSSVTALGDILANLGRASARFPFADNGNAAEGRLLDLPSDAARWKPVIERLVPELRRLGALSYSAWGPEPFRGIGEIVAMGFEAVGLYPTYDGTDLHVRVP
jgi:hypothetical protein